MTFDKDQLKRLAQAHKQFDDAVYHERIRSASRWLTEEVVAIYEAATGKQVNHNFSCSICVLNIYKHIGRIYFDDLAEIEAEENAEKTIEEKPEETPEEKSEIVEVVEEQTNTSETTNVKKQNSKKTK